jgi:hypothetical protein
MTQDQHDAISMSLAQELHRVGHMMTLPDDIEERRELRAFDLAYLVEAIPDLCANNIRALCGIVYALHVVQRDRHQNEQHVTAS